MASADVTAELRCSICMEIYRDPVTLPCGHNFCRDCITLAWDHQVHLREYKCPGCQRIYRKRPELVRNTTLHQIAKSFHATETDEEQTGVLCNYCDFPVPATKSCLQCEISLCDHHLRKHDRSGGHTLLPPTTDLGKRKCSAHKKFLEYYCIEDAACVCVTCSVKGRHVGHKMMSLDEASEEKKKKLRKELQRLKVKTEEVEETVEGLEECRREAQEKADGKKNRVNTLITELRRPPKNPKERVQIVEECRRKAQEKADGETERVTTLFRNFRRRLEDLKKRVLSDITRQSQCYDDVIRQQEIKKEELSRKMRHIEELCNMTDPLTVLQESDTGDLCDTEDRERYDKQLHDGGDLDVAGISHTLHTGLADIMSEVTGGISVQHADILMYVNSASNYLCISDDRMTSLADRSQDHSKTSERFQGYAQVLGRQGFSSGQHYWEVDVGLSQVKAYSETERVTALFKDLRRRLKDLEEKVLSDITRQVDFYDDVIRQQEIKKAELSRKMRHIEELCNMTDPLTVLQESDTGDLCDTEDRHDTQLHDGGDLDVAGVSHTLHTGLSDIMSEVTGGIYIQPAEILLDVNSAGNNLHISDDKKSASWASHSQNRQKTPHRFQDYPQVLSRQSFSSGRHYWEVDVGESDNWTVGVCYPSVDRRGDQSEVGYNNKSWCLCRDGNDNLLIHDSEVIDLPDGIPSDRVRIYLDYEAGQISFYALCDPIRHLHTFTATLTEPLHAAFGVGYFGDSIKIYRCNQL